MKSLLAIALTCGVAALSSSHDAAAAKTPIFQPKDSKLTFLNKSGWTANYTFEYRLAGQPKSEKGAVTGGLRKVFSIPKDATNITFKAMALGRGDYTINETLRAENTCIQAHGTVFNPSSWKGTQCLPD